VKRITASLPDDVASLLGREARRRNVSIADVVRDGVRGYLGLTPDSPRHPPFANLGSSGYRHTARDLEKALAEAWSDPRDR
jgi:hypothetical protein